MTREQIKQAMLDPSQVFSSPADVLAADGLEREDKIEILRRWEYDAHEIQVADEEGFEGPGAGQLLDEIVSALHSLGTGPDVERSPPSKAGSV